MRLAGPGSCPNEPLGRPRGRRPLFPLRTGFADYLLYVAGKAVGVIEAKPEGHTLTGVEIQSAKYTLGVAEQIPHYVLPLPFAYETTGTETQFTNGLDPAPCSRGVFRFHRPEELIRLAEEGKAQLRDGLRHLPVLNEAGLWRVQVEAIHNLGASLAAGRPRALIQMATGSGKTYTACSFCYRLITFAKARRILFLVDRNTLGKQALNEFQRYTSPYTNYAFTEEFPVQRLTRNTIDPAAKVCITTIQRLYSMLKGEEEYPEDNEDPSLFEAEPSPLVSESLPVVYNPRIPIEAFDVIVVDECHRSIYNLWRQVLEYFDAFIVGLTTPPIPRTCGRPSNWPNRSASRPTAAEPWSISWPWSGTPSTPRPPCCRWPSTSSSASPRGCKRRNKPAAASPPNSAAGSTSSRTTSPPACASSPTTSSSPPSPNSAASARPTKCLAQSSRRCSTN